MLCLRFPSAPCVCVRVPLQPELYGTLDDDAVEAHVVHVARLLSVGLPGVGAAPAGSLQDRSDAMA